MFYYFVMEHLGLPSRAVQNVYFEVYDTTLMHD